MPKVLFYDRLGPSKELRDFLIDHPWTCPACGGYGEYETGHGPRGCNPCNSRLVFFVDENGKRQELDYGDAVVVDDSGRTTIVRERLIIAAPNLLAKCKELKDVADTFARQSPNPQVGDWNWPSIASGLNDVLTQTEPSTEGGAS